MPAPFEPSSRVNIVSPRYGLIPGTVSRAHPIGEDLWRIMVNTDDGRGPWLLHVHDDGTCAAPGYTIEAAS